MIISFIRALIIYLLIIFALRFMGKRQIGELQPTELVVTILISEVASIPLEDTDSPLIYTFIPIAVIICLELIISGINLHSYKFRRIFGGKPVIVINNGTVDQQALKNTRISIADLLDSLRLKGYFDIQAVKYAIIEMNGQISVMPKESEAPPTAKDLGMQPRRQLLPFTVINDGKIIKAHFNELGIDRKQICARLKEEQLDLKEVLLMTADADGNFLTIKRDETI